MKLKILNSKEKKRILSLIEEQFGCKPKIQKTFLRNTKDKILLIDDALQHVEIDKLRVDSMGMYFGTLHDELFRPSIEGSQIIGREATRNVIILNDAELEMWIKGEDILIDLPREHGPIMLIKHGKDLYGAAKAHEKDGRLKLLNHVPKIRRMKTVNWD